ncbi:hypothetical protein ACFYWS_07310 [Streptomyces sp. NPDC002795]|uniref:hypothetical protein n=1 Tax=Streptomyces sp. NPDC002795 TaxID=3364665 RepID=UPI0036B01089
MSVAARLQELRVRAGSPSFREIERLLAKQGRTVMARSTVQEKLSGKRPANLTQVLAIVEALAEIARLNGTPLPHQEVDAGVWRERVTAAFKRHDPQQVSSAPSIEGSRTLERWPVGALLHAQMYDLVELVEGNRDSPTDTWITSVIRPMLTAKMSISEFMDRAAQDDTQTTIRTIRVLNADFPPPEGNPWEPTEPPWGTTDNDLTVGKLLKSVATHHDTQSAPAIVVGLRLAEVPNLATVYLKVLACTQEAPGIKKAATLLRAASLNNDADSLLGFVGSERFPTTESIKIAEQFHTNRDFPDSDKILGGIAKGGPHSLRDGLEALNAHPLEASFKPKILHGIPWGNHEKMADALVKNGDADAAQAVLEVKDEPPF